MVTTKNDRIRIARQVQPGLPHHPPRSCQGEHVFKDRPVLHDEKVAAMERLLEIVTEFKDALKAL